MNNIKSVFTIANDKWSLVYGDDEVSHQTNVDTSSDLYHLLKNNKTVDIHTKTSVWKGFELTNISGGILIGHCQGIPIGILIKSVIGVTVGGVYQAFVDSKKVPAKEPVKLSSEERFNNFKRVYPEILKLDSFLKAIVQEPQFSEYKKTLLTSYESEFTPEIWSNFCSYWESIKGAIVTIYKKGGKSFQIFQTIEALPVLISSLISRNRIIGWCKEN